MQDNGCLIGEAMLKSNELWGFDNVNIFLNAEVGLDSIISDKRLRYPFSHSIYKVPLIKSQEDLKRLVFPNYREKNSMSEIVRAADYLHRKVGNDVGLIGGFGGISTWALLLRGSSNFFKDYKSGASLQAEYLEFLTKVAIDYCVTQIKTGCDCIMTMEDLFALEVMGPTAFDLLGNYLKRLSEAVHEAGGFYVLHCCGNCERSIEEMLKTGADVLSIDRTDLGRIKTDVGGRATVMGNIKTYEMVSKPNTAIRKACNEAIRTAKPDGKFILSSGYICPPQTPADNMAALVCSAEEYGYYC